MRALRITAPGRFEVVEVEKPTCGDDQVLIRMRYSALCNQSDSKVFRARAGGLEWLLPSLTGQPGVGDRLLQFLKLHRGEHFPMEPGFPGHEGSGVVEGVGGGVSDLSIGDHVTLTGIGGPPLHQQYVTRNAGTAIRVSDAVPLEQAAVLELYGCVHHCVSKLDDWQGRTVAVAGVGPAGLCAIQLVGLLRPAQLIALDLSPPRLQRAREQGATDTVDAGDTLAVAELMREGVEVVVDCTGSGESLRRSFAMSRDEVLIFGYTDVPFMADESVWFRNELTIRASRILGLDDLCAVVSLVEAGELHPRALITHSLTLDRYDEAVRLVECKEAIKVLIDLS